MLPRERQIFSWHVYIFAHYLNVQLNFSQGLLYSWFRDHKKNYEGGRENTLHKELRRHTKYAPDHFFPSTLLPLK